MKCACENNINRFLDVEALVDNDEDEEINDDLDNDGMSSGI
jgi:hypothetical protein